MDQLIYESRVHEPPFPFSDTDGWMPWDRCSKEQYDDYLVKIANGEPYQVRILKVVEVHGPNLKRN